MRPKRPFQIPPGAKSLGINLPAAPKPETDKPKKRRGVANGTEQAFGKRLDHLASLGVIDKPEFEGVTLLVSRTEVGAGKKGDTRYTPDYVVHEPSGKMTVFEIKGLIREKDRLRIKVAAERWPHISFLMVVRAGKTGWELIPYGSRAVQERAKWAGLL